MAEADKPLRSGWTTGACAAAAAKAAYFALAGRGFPDPVDIVLPRGERPVFALSTRRLESGAATAGVIKDGGDDPDVTHGAEVLVTVRRGAPGSGIVFKGGVGVGIVTRPGIPVPVGEPAINPGPRRIVSANLLAAADETGGPTDVEVTISIPKGVELAEKTLNPRLGIVGGLSVLGTTGVVVPYSCEAFIQTIQRAVKVAAASGAAHVAASTGFASERAARRVHGLPDVALIDMGDFVGGLLKYLRAHPLPRLTLAGGFAKFVKLGEGELNVHSKESRVDFGKLAALVGELGGDAELVAACRAANTAIEVLERAHAAGLPLGDAVAARCRAVATGIVKPETIVDVLVVDRSGEVVGRAP
ncbi:putative cobalt-precorrin-6A synthase (deacetylating) [uncultured Alphaproteobacteria bacterium]|uniref:Cobalt-precorrin-5B C(1)-methyltransferase n=1 Tax=uncultured Alphaproteobacteria bacterium TaxID=91750 RepID=A0A212K925_9PROT|nr:putative cobalt-precorrin-6A synthase (deacetylating) [uncultured Alphaproteobacteria bacterium]